MRILSIIRYVAAFSLASFSGTLACSPFLSLSALLTPLGFLFIFILIFLLLSILNSTLNFCFVFISCGRGESPKTRIIFHFLPHRLCVYVFVYMCVFLSVCMCVCVAQSPCRGGPAPHSAFNVRNLLVFSSSSFSLMWFFRLNQFYYCLFLLYISLFSFSLPYALPTLCVCMQCMSVRVCMCVYSFADFLLANCGCSVDWVLRVELCQLGPQLPIEDYIHTNIYRHTCMCHNSALKSMLLPLTEAS